MSSLSNAGEVSIDQPDQAHRQRRDLISGRIVADGSEPIECICHENQTFLKLTGRARR
jgi:hypothetical protein